MDDVLRARIPLDVLYEAVAEPVLVLDPRGRIVFANRGARELLGEQDPAALLGRLPGQAFHCVHAGSDSGENQSEAPTCGREEACASCGVCAAVRSAREGKTDSREGRVDRGSRREAFELLVRATPLRVGGRPYTILSSLDLRHAKRRRVLERVFFHDIINTAQGLKMMAGLLSGSGPQRQAEISSVLQGGLSRLLEEIRQQKELAAAERDDLRTRVSPIDARELLEELRGTFERQGMDQKRRIVIEPGTERVVFPSDRTLITRVLSGMIRNAVEACAVGDTVTLGCLRRGEEVELWVHNPQPMIVEVQRQVFQRSFSTRGAGRGLGTYSMRLLSEKYLNGRVGFVSSPAEGTRFHARYPLAGPD